MAVDSIPPDLHQTVKPRIESFEDLPYRGVHCAIDFDMANLSMVEVDGGYVAIDAGTVPRVALMVDEHWQRIATGELAALILTHSHTDHNGGASVFSRRNVPVWGHRAYFDEFDLTQMLPDAYLTRGAKQFGLQLDESTVETWEDPLDELADQLTAACRAIDPQSTDEALIQPGSEADDLIGPGRRNA